MDKIIIELSKKYNLPKFIIEQIAESQFRYTRDVMAKGDLDNVRHIHLGSFIVAPFKAMKWREKAELRARLKADPEFEKQWREERRARVEEKLLRFRRKDDLERPKADI